MPNKLQILSDEITNDPLTRGYAGMTDAEVLADLKRVYRTVIRPLSHPALTRALAQNGRLAKLKRAAEQWSDETKDLQTSIAMVASAFIHRDQSSLDPSNPSDVALVNALVQVGVLSAADKQALVDAATVQISRADELSIGGIRENDIRKVRS